MEWVDATSGELKSSRDASIDFGVLSMGQQRSKQVRVSNIGDAPITLDRLEQVFGETTRIGAETKPSSVFEIAFVEGAPLDPGMSTVLEARFFAPTDALLKTKEHLSSLELTSSGTAADGKKATLTLKGTAVATPCDVPKGLDFGSVMKGQANTLSFQLTNKTEVETTAQIGDLYAINSNDLAFTFEPNSARGSVSIPPNGFKEVSIRFSPVISKQHAAALKLTVSPACPEAIFPLVGTGVDALLTWSPMKLDFGAPAPGFSVTRELTFANAGAAPFVLSAFQILSPEFSVMPAVSTLTVPSNGVAKLTLEFKPNVPGARDSVFSFKTNVSAQPAGDVALTGFGEGPKIKLSPNPLDFGKLPHVPSLQGPVASTPSSTYRQVVVSNVGTTVPGSAADFNLKLGTVVNGVAGQAPIFAVVAKSPQTVVQELSVSLGSYDPLVGLIPNAVAEITIQVKPMSLGTKDWELWVKSNDPRQPITVLPITAEITRAPTCNYSINRTSLGFGLVGPGQTRELGFQITNHSTHPGDDCLITNFELLPQSSPVFTLPSGSTPSVALAPGAAAIVWVRATGQASPSQVVNGVLRFEASSPVAVSPRVSAMTVFLTAKMKSPCLMIAPDDFDFGTVAVNNGCSSPPRTFNVYNTCTTPIYLDSITAGTVNPEFILSLPTLPAVLTQGAAPLTFEVKYRPVDVKEASQAIELNLIQSGVADAQLLTVRGRADTAGLNVETYVVPTKSDVLMVMDDSCSMAAHQANVANSFLALPPIDYQIAVTTTDNGLGGLQGKFVTASAHPESIISVSTPDGLAKLQAKVQPGTLGSGVVQPLATAVRALTPPLSNNDNSGFVRSDAHLGVLIVTDKEDFSAQTSGYYYDALLNVKGWRARNQFSVSAMTCPLTGPGRVDAVAELSGGGRGELCNPATFNQQLTALTSRAFGARTVYFLKATAAVTALSPVEVKIDSVLVAPTAPSGAKRWSFDSVKNAVVFEPQFAPQPGQLLELQYAVGCH